jgi:tetratricopeptide (TPR) repeat protein
LHAIVRTLHLTPCTLHLIACTRHVARGTLHLGLALLFASATVSTQPHAPHRIPSVPDELLARPIPLRDGIGRAHDSVTTSSKDAQAFYDQGLAYLHSYVWIEAARSFNQALRLDPRLAMADVGLSYAYVELNAPAKAKDAIDRARALEPAISDHERRHIAARALQMAAESSPADAAKLAAYRAELDRAVQSFPDDAEFWLLRGIAESTDPADRGQGSPQSAVKFFERALTASPGHFAAHHYLAHALENAGRPAEALPHAAAYAAGASEVPHALHMHGHVLRRMGRIDEAIAAFERANRLETAYFTAEKVPPELDWHHEHNLDLLASSYRYLGQSARAESALKTAFDLPSALIVQMFNKRGWPEFLISRGRLVEALAAADRLIAHPEPLVRATGHVAAGHVHLAAKRYKEAAAETNAALKDLQTARDGGALVGSAFQHLQGEFFLGTGQGEKGRAMLREVVRRAREATGPDNWVQALFVLEAMARAAREAGDWPFAAWLAEEMRSHDPQYAGTHYALALVAAHNGNTAAARTEFAAAERLWSKADATLPELRDIRTHQRSP